MTEPTKVTLAHSPDSDDAFMFYALAEGLVDTEGLTFEHMLRDIETAEPVGQGRPPGRDGALRACLRLRP